MMFSRASSPLASHAPSRAFFPGLAALALIAALGWSAPQAAEPAVVIPPPAVDQPPSGSTSETAVLAGGCFWGVQGVFQHVQGVSSVVSGYSGGSQETATYAAVGTGSTGHAEAVRIVFDPGQISYGRLLQIFFSVAHNPTQLNRQGPDVGTQYRSTIFPTHGAQARVAVAYIEQLGKARVFGKKKLATTIEPIKAFYPAEAEHQDYLTLNPRKPYIVVHDLPKIEHLKKLFPDVYRDKPVLVGSTTAAKPR